MVGHRFEFVMAFDQVKFTFCRLVPRNHDMDIIFVVDHRFEFFMNIK